MKRLSEATRLYIFTPVFSLGLEHDNSSPSLRIKTKRSYQSKLIFKELKISRIRFLSLLFMVNVPHSIRQLNLFIMIDFADYLPILSVLNKSEHIGKLIVSEF